MGSYQLIDEVKIFVKSGTGGDGCMSFRREANVPKGGPDGGDGGKGGDVIFKCVSGAATLIDFRYKQHFKAARGEGGKGKNRHGANAKDLVINVPLGTQIFSDETELLIVDFTEIGQEFILAKGGDGGFGNTRFKSSINQAPRKITKGKVGEELWVWLKLKIISDVGLVGLPNAGKSTFLSRVSRAKPKIANYPFTTLKPNLGVVYIDDKEFVMADIPGLIEGAHNGVGLGIRFLKHVERCRVIIHLIDGTAEDIIEPYKVIRNELQEYSQLLSDKEEIIVINKIDAINSEDLQLKKSQLEELTGKKIFTVSAVTGKKIEKILREALKILKEY